MINLSDGLFWAAMVLIFMLVADWAIQRHMLRSASLPHRASLVPSPVCDGRGSKAEGRVRETQRGEGSSRPYLDGRVVYCADCEDKRPLTLSPAGVIVCSACASPYWTYIERTFPAPTPAGQELVEIEQLERMYDLPPSPRSAFVPLPPRGRGSEAKPGEGIQETRDEYVARITRQAVERLNRAQERAEGR